LQRLNGRSPAMDTIEVKPDRPLSYQSAEFFDERHG